LGGAIYSLGIVDGIEVDLQISKDGTLWLEHDVELSSCGGVDYKCFTEATDSKIIALDSCNGDVRNYTKLEDVFSYMSSNYPNAYISLDVKSWTPCAISSSGIVGMMNAIGDEIIRLTQKYNLQDRVMVESETASFITYVKNNSTGIGCYLTAFGDFERGIQLALEENYTGISFKYKFEEEIGIEEIQLLRKKGLKIQLWTVNSEADIEEAISINPDFIQTDNIEYFR
jgi:glycerophosphoryl diester phosphodiesterase